MVNSIIPSIQRLHERVTTALLVHSKNGQGQTRDLSVSGVYFELNNSRDLNDEVVFELELQFGRENLLMKCQGQIVRVEDKGEKTGLGVRILDSQLFMQTKAA